MATGRTGTTWWVIARDLVVGGQLVTGDTPAASVTYATTRNGLPLDAGALSWEANGHEGAWSAPVRLPSTPGPLTCVVTVTATIDGVLMTGAKQQSIDVI